MTNQPALPDDSELVLWTRQGDADAFTELIRRYQNRANALAYRLLNNRDDAMEVVQESFVKAFTKISSLQDPRRFRTWFWRIVGNLALNRRRSRALRKTLSLDNRTDDAPTFDRPDHREPTPLASAVGDDLQEAIRQAVSELPDAQRIALVLFSMEHMPQKEIADILQCSVEAVKWNVFAARKTLRQRLEHLL